MKIYIIFGTTGEGKGRETWIYKALSSKERAEELLNQLKSNGPLTDPNFRTDYIGTEYYYKESELELEEMELDKL